MNAIPTKARNPNLLDEDDLKSWLGFQQRTALIERLKEQKIPYFYGKGGAVCTTVGAVESALCGRKTAAEDSIEFRF